MVRTDVLSHHVRLAYPFVACHQQWTACASDGSWTRPNQRTQSLQNEIEYAKVLYASVCIVTLARLLHVGLNAPWPTCYDYGRTAANAAEAHAHVL